ncbi:MAG: glycosyl hydrolase [Flavobacteriaceae bacterium CG_4_8_14_3_um_filter_34_10]|nr:glycosyl hydrolase [Flavobacteriia bacterium]OIP52749.1 MAG: glycosyl hydrolase [Flavobacteriaceae bacterium CG2_30_34_30]PIQ17696.1 MAG: glycosyl hydrolase [Flavobacteriaceae bacterium CG18_big_fil_WC_8_21_14_2_50_34_36]PIV51205.1 MAG: glycosyl hydrolase [Flavobacteriaceae bacterium CG02_land_8_20_14_3_00_34_13]PIX08214.1 MAG: glycosyl hydrolase [Flavobacteriaceae bacterium CG_4_8_14_3_um_filter_34_10]PIZ07846.1 MAG: glycosyl hydrolase [Flavobacteriaceae bacterium CG_4_10_14_0_8_um_filter_
MNLYKALQLQSGNAICYSGFRQGQQPGGEYPTYQEVKEDLELLQNHWKYLRIYDCDLHAKTVLKVIKKEKMNFKVLLGAYIVAEMNNFGCPWGGVYSEEILKQNKKYNKAQINKLISFANQYPETICALSVGNEACAEWTDHYVSVESVIKYVRMVKNGAKQPVTFCENYVPWLNKLEPLVAEIDFISIHSYPVWEYKNIHDALQVTQQNYHAVASKFCHKPVIITEAGWATNSNGNGILPHNVSEELQEIYIKDLMKWSEQEKILTFVFEAFDESWKGSNDAMEPEKHWGLYNENRNPKLILKNKNFFY